MRYNYEKDATIKVCETIIQYFYYLCYFSGRIIAAILGYVMFE